MPTPDYISQDERIIRRLRPFVDDHVDALPEATREVLRRHLEHGDLQYDVERQGPENRWHVVVGVAGERLVGVDALTVGLVIDDDGQATYRPDPLLDDDLADGDDASSWF